MLQAKKRCSSKGLSFTVFVANLQLYKLAVEVSWVYPRMFDSQFGIRLGGMHLLMDYIGSIGKLMTNTGLLAILTSSFGGVAKMLSGKFFPQN